MKHTPAPWIHRAGLDGGANIGTADGYAICDMAFHYSSLKRDELEADAKLITAAPDLLYALKLVSWLHAQQITPETAAVIKAAITKAGGDV